MSEIRKMVYEMALASVEIKDYKLVKYDPRTPSRGEIPYKGPQLKV
jgi:hypothetical protein